MFCFRSQWKGSNYVTGNGGLVTYSGTQGTNAVNNTGSIIAYDTDGGFTTLDAGFLLASIYTSSGGQTTIGSTRQGGIKSIYSNSGTNTINAGGISDTRTDSAGVNSDSKISGLVAVHALNGQTTTVGAVEGAMLIAVADSLYGSAAVTGKGGTLIGAGRTNDLPYTASIGYGGDWFSVRTNGYRSTVHIEAADATVNWNQATNVYAGVVTLPAGSQSVFITNAVVTANACVVATINSDDTTATTTKAIPTAGLLQLKAVAAATADTKISWHIVAP